jgi:hypothetical protein
MEGALTAVDVVADEWHVSYSSFGELKNANRVLAQYRTSEWNRRRPQTKPHQSLLLFS